MQVHNNGPSPLPSTNVELTYPANVKDGAANEYVLYLSSVSDLGAKNTRCNLAGLINPGNLESVSMKPVGMTLMSTVCLVQLLAVCVPVYVCLSDLVSACLSVGMSTSI